MASELLLSAFGPSVVFRTYGPQRAGVTKFCGTAQNLHLTSGIKILFFLPRGLFVATVSPQSILFVLKPGRDVTPRDRSPRKVWIDRTRGDYQALVELDPGEILGFRFGLEHSG
jgi:hypothetical protein